MSTQEKALGYEGIDFKQFLTLARQPTPAEFLKERVGWKDKPERGGATHMVTYVEWPYVVNRLNELHPRWSSRIVYVQVVGTYVACVVALTIDGVTRDGMGVGALEKNDSSNVVEAAIKGAASDGLKRAAVLFGIALELYEVDHNRTTGGNSGGGASDQRYQSSGGGGQKTYPPATKPADPRATSASDILSTGQINAIRAIARDLGIDPDDMAFKEFNLRIEDLNKKAASYLIDTLKKRQEGGGPPPPATTTTTTRPTEGVSFVPGGQKVPHINEVTRPKWTKPPHQATPAQVELLKKVCSDNGVNPLHFIAEQWQDESLALADLSRIAVTAAINYMRDEYIKPDDIPF